MLKTSEEWNKEANGCVRVMDPDGWDRSNFQFSWYEEKISKQEFCNRVFRSTTDMMKHKEFDAWARRDTKTEKENDRM